MASTSLRATWFPATWLLLCGVLHHRALSVTITTDSDVRWEEDTEVKLAQSVPLMRRAEPRKDSLVEDILQDVAASSTTQLAVYITSHRDHQMQAEPGNPKFEATWVPSAKWTLLDGGAANKVKMKTFDGKYLQDDNGVVKIVSSLTSATVFHLIEATDGKVQFKSAGNRYIKDNAGNLKLDTSSGSGAKFYVKMVGLNWTHSGTSLLSANATDPSHAGDGQLLQTSPQNTAFDEQLMRTSNTELKVWLTSYRKDCLAENAISGTISFLTGHATNQRFLLQDANGGATHKVYIRTPEVSTRTPKRNYLVSDSGQLTGRSTSTGTGISSKWIIHDAGKGKAYVKLPGASSHQTNYLKDDGGSSALANNGPTDKEKFEIRLHGIHWR